MHVVVVGCGRVGSGLAISLTKEGHSVAIMDKNVRAFRRLKEWDGPRIVGSGFDRDDLEKAGAIGADPDLVETFIALLERMGPTFGQDADYKTELALETRVEKMAQPRSA